LKTKTGNKAIVEKTIAELIKYSKKRCGERSNTMNRKTETIPIRCTADFKKVVHELAELSGQTVSGYIKQLIIDDMKRKIKNQNSPTE
jgi:hypothetical protein